MKSAPVRQGEISLDFAENFPYEHAEVGQPGKTR